MTNQYRILPTDPVDRQAAADDCCRAVGLPTSRTIRVYILEFSGDYYFEPVGVDERDGWIPADYQDVDEQGNYIPIYQDSIESTYHSRNACLDACEDKEIPARVSFCSEEDALRDACASEIIDYVDVEVPYMIFGTESDYHDMVVAAARRTAVEDGIIE